MPSVSAFLPAHVEKRLGCYCSEAPRHTQADPWRKAHHGRLPGRFAGRTVGSSNGQGGGNNRKTAQRGAGIRGEGQRHEGQVKVQQQQTDQIFSDQARLRENMKSLKGSAEEKALLQRYTKQLDDEETQVDTLRKKKQDLEGQRQLSDVLLRSMIQQLQM